MGLVRVRWQCVVVSFALLSVGPAWARAQGQTTSPAAGTTRQEQPANPDQQEDQGSKPSLITPLQPRTETEPYTPITARQRLRWLITNTIGPPHLAGGVVTSAFGTALDRPREYGPGWPGFGERFGIRLSGVSTSNIMEASAGALWGEDPRYFRVPEESFGARLRNVTRADLSCSQAQWKLCACVRAFRGYSRQQLPVECVAAGQRSQQSRRSAKNAGRFCGPDERQCVR